MSDAPTADSVGFTARNSVCEAALSPQSIDAILADFRCWLEEFGTEPLEPTESSDLELIISQFTALRHEVNLQTRASRAIAERAEKSLDAPSPLIKIMLDLIDALSASLKQMRKIPSVLGPLVTDLETHAVAMPDRPKSGWLARLLGMTGAADAAWQEWHDAVQKCESRRREQLVSATRKLEELAVSAADGYAISLRRIEAALPQFGLVPIETVGLLFDPQTMEVVELGGSGPSGTVTEEIRRGYLCNGIVVRYAQVRVAG